MRVPKKGSLLRELPLLLITAVIASIIVKAFIFQAFYIPSGSMENTLQINDRVIVNKLGNYVGHIGRGDVVVFVDPGGWLPPAPTSSPNSATTMIKKGVDQARHRGFWRSHCLLRPKGSPRDKWPEHC
jgi:signal peptidase I